ncbi:MAG: rhodanese-like domain-containing protein [Dehalococcoidales bacterium]|nr:rhodanese-like domain-containing protein [Dehalococcoidales bacterium]
MTGTKRKYFGALALLVVFGLVMAAGCAQTGAQVISPQEATALIQENGNNPDFIIIDVRTPQEYNDGHIVGSVNIDFYAADFRDRISALDRSKTYLIYCQSGNRSGQSRGMMVELGFEKIYDIGGGIVAWRAAGLPTVK